MAVLERVDGRSLLTWEATPKYGSPTSSGQVIHGGMVTTILDSAMGGASWSALTEVELFAAAAAARLLADVCN